MIELIYPVSPAPLLKGCKRGTAAEMLPIVDELGNVRAQAPRDQVHHGTKPLHPVVHLHVINRRSELYLQQRGAHKDLLPLYWDTAVGGHVAYGEYIRPRSSGCTPSCPRGTATMFLSLPTNANW